jgi:hypothetical protein
MSPQITTQTTTLYNKLTGTKKFKFVFFCHNKKIANFIVDQHFNIFLAHVPCILLPIDKVKYKFANKN